MGGATCDRARLASGRYCTTASSARARRSLKSSRPGYRLDPHLDVLDVDAGAGHLDDQVVHDFVEERVVVEQMPVDARLQVERR